MKPQTGFYIARNLLLPGAAGKARAWLDIALSQTAFARRALQGLFLLGKDFDEHSYVVNINSRCIGQGRSKDFVVDWEGKLREKTMHGILFLLNCDIRALA